MKFWGTIIGSVVVITVMITWIVLARGAPETPKPLEDPPKTRAESKDKPGAVVFAARPLMEFREPQVDNIVRVVATNSVVGKENGYTFRFRNAGKGELRVAFVKISCSCNKGLRIDGKELPHDIRHEVVKPAAEEGTIEIRWAPREDMLGPGEDEKPFSLSATLNTNDPRFYGDLVLEIRTLLVHPKKEKAN